MNEVPKDSILEYPSDTIQCIRKLYGLDNIKVLRESIDALQDWVNKQTHFVKKDFERSHLEWSLLTSKGSIERAKERLDKYCTGKVIHKKMFMKFDFHVEFNNYNKYNEAMLPKFSDNYYRVAIFKMLELPKVSNDILSVYRYTTIFMEYLRGFCYLNGVIVILDYSDVSVVELVKVINIADMHQFISVVVDCFGMRVKGIHIITPSNFVEILVSMIKKGLSAKLGERITVHKKYETLYNFIPKNILPVNYGGSEKSLAELDDMWRNKLSNEENLEFLKIMQEFRTEESYRQLADFNNQNMGTTGSFRTFIVD